MEMFELCYAIFFHFIFSNATGSNPFRRHWDKVFGWVDAIIFDCCLAIPLVLYACFFVYTETPPTIGNIIATVIAAIVGAVVGLVILVDCWRRCSNIIEIIFLPLVMIMVFCMIILFWWIFLLLMGFATSSDAACGQFLTLKTIRT